MLAYLRTVAHPLANSLGIDHGLLQHALAALSSIHVPYALSIFQWNGPGDVAAVVLCLLAMEIRAWSMRELGRFFTFQIGVSKDQHIVKTGPYRYVRHPSYTGLIVMLGIGSSLARAASSMVWLLNDALFCHAMGLLFCIVTFVGFILMMAVARLPQEEKMLGEAFGKEWEEFAATRARLVP
ncbi:hypothetical protein SYNPS1DRAFT_19872, partial [Syncephalis pseudoplumigaleata]